MLKTSFMILVGLLAVRSHVAGRPHILYGAAVIPHPSKRATGGEDAFFYDDGLGMFGVADGVGGSRRGNVDPGAFSREMLERCHSAGGMVQEMLPGATLSETMMLAADQDLVNPGSSTLILGQLESKTSTLRLLNLGD